MALDLMDAQVAAALADDEVVAAVVAFGLDDSIA